MNVRGFGLSSLIVAFNESISTVTGQPHGHSLYSWNSGYWWLRKGVRCRLGQTGPDPVGAAMDARLGDPKPLWGDQIKETINKDAVREGTCLRRNQ